MLLMQKKSSRGFQISLTSQTTFYWDGKKKVWYILTNEILCNVLQVTSQAYVHSEAFTITGSPQNLIEYTVGLLYGGDAHVQYDIITDTYSEQFNKLTSDVSPDNDWVCTWSFPSCSSR